MTDSGSPTFAIMGSGGMGGYIGAKLTQAGYRVSFVARGTHLEAMNANGFKIEGPDEAFVIKPIRATSDPSEIGPVDFVVFCVKLWDTESAAAQCQDLIGPDTAVLSMQNGVDPEPVLSDILGREHVMGELKEPCTSLSAAKVKAAHIARTRIKHLIADSFNPNREEADPYSVRPSQTENPSGFSPTPVFLFARWCLISPLSTIEITSFICTRLLRIRLLFLHTLGH